MEDEIIIRMSSAGSCRLRTAHDILGTPGLERDSDDELPMRMGTHLEPVVVWQLQQKGLTTYFAKEQADDPQLELRDRDPVIVGHPDGIVSLEGPADSRLTHWLGENLPPQAVRILDLDQDPMLLEIKTMNANTFQQIKDGGLANGTFTRLYLEQVNTYLGAMIEGDIPDELDELLAQKGWRAPTAALVASFCIPSKRYAFEVVEYDEERYFKRKQELDEGLMVPLLEDRWPEPDYDGAAPYCYFCPYSHVCPAAEEKRKNRSFDDIVLVEDESLRLDGLAKQYTQVREDISDLESHRAELRQQIGDLVPVGVRLSTDNYRIVHSEVSGRRSPDLDVIAEELGVARDELPMKRGRPSKRLNVDALGD